MEMNAPMKAALAVGALALVAMSASGGPYKLQSLSPRRLVAQLLRSTHLPWSDWLARIVSKHRVRTYAALLVLGFIGYRGQDYVMRHIRLFLQYDRVNPTDELTEYPHQVGPARKPEGGSGEAGQSGAGQALATLPTPLGATPRRSMTSTLLQHLQDRAAMDPEVLAALGEHGARVLSSVGHTFQLTRGAAISLAQKSRAVTLQPGETLFRAGDDAADGVYVVVSGALCVRGDPRGPGMVVDDCILEGGCEASRDAWQGGPTPFTPGGGFGLDTALHSHTAYGLPGTAQSDAGTKSRTAGTASTADPILCVFEPGSTLGENSLLAGPSATRVVSVEAASGGAPTSLLHVDRPTYEWFLHQWPRSSLNFILTTTARQYRVAFFALVDFLGLPQAAFAAQEAHPHPAVRLEGTESDSPLTPAKQVSGQGEDALPSVARSAVVSAATSTVQLDAGATLFKEGDAADCLYVLMSGSASAYVEEGESMASMAASVAGSVASAAHSSGSQEEAGEEGGGKGGVRFSPSTPAPAPPNTVWVGNLADGSIAGGVSCFVDTPRRATIICNSPCRWAVFSRRAFLLAARDLEGSSTAGAGDLTVLQLLAQRIAQALTPLLRMFLGLGLQRVWLGAGDTLYEAGEEADGLYLVISGRLRIDLTQRAGGEDSAGRQSGKDAAMHVTRGGVQGADDVGTAALELAMGGRVRRLDVTRGESVGEVAVLAREGGATRDHTVMCVRDCELVRVTPEAFDWIATAHPSIMRKFATTMAQRYGALLARLHGMPSAPRPGPAAATAARAEATHRLHRAASTGRLNHAVSLAGLNLMSSLTRATVGSAGVERGGRPATSQLPLGAAAHTPTGRSDIATIAVLPAGARGVGQPLLSAFVTTLADCLRAHGDVVVVTASTLDEVLGVGCAAGVDSVFARARITAWLSTQEEQHRFVLLVGDLGLPDWCATAYSQADLALLVGTAGADPGLNAVEAALAANTHPAGDPRRETAIDNVRPSRTVTRLAAGLGLGNEVGALLRSVGAAGPTPQAPRHSVPRYHTKEPPPPSSARRELVLLYTDPNAKPNCTRNWLRHRSLSWHHHVRAAVPGDVARVGRFIAGTAVGVVLGGGGARGLAHLGVFKVLEDRGIPVDFIGGTSQGAFMGGCYAKTMSARKAGELARLLANEIGSPMLYLRMTLPMIAYFSGAFFNEVLQSTFGDTQIEDLWVKYFCVSTNVTADTMDIHHTGPLWRYARASMTIIGLLPPLMDVQGHLLVDGGYVNNLPVDVMHALCPSIGTILAVDVENKDNSAVEGVDREEYGDSLSGWYLAGRALLGLLGLAKPLTIPSMSVFTMKVSYISHTMAMRSMIARLQDATRRADPNTPRFVYIRPDVQGYSLLQYGKWTEIVNHGLMEAERALSSITAQPSGILPAAPPARPRQSSESDLLRSPLHRGSKSMAALSSALGEPLDDTASAPLTSAAASGGASPRPVLRWDSVEPASQLPPSMDSPPHETGSEPSGSHAHLPALRVHSNVV